MKLLVAIFTHLENASLLLKAQRVAIGTRPEERTQSVSRWRSLTDIFVNHEK
jgi:hypothetical protein